MCSHKKKKKRKECEQFYPNVEKLSEQHEHMLHTDRYASFITDVVGVVQVWALQICHTHIQCNIFLSIRRVC